MSSTIAPPRRAVTYSSFPLLDATPLSPIRDSFTSPLRKNSIREIGTARRASRSGSYSENTEDLFTHPSARIVSFEAIPVESKGSNADAPVLSWSTNSERTLAQGPLRIYRIKLQCAFLQCGSTVHPLLPKAIAWCVDEAQLIFVLKVRLNNYWRVEMAKIEHDLFDLVNFKGVLGSLIGFENTPCPFRVEKDTKIYEEPAPLLVFKRRPTISKPAVNLKPLTITRESDKLGDSFEDKTTIVATATEPSSRASTLRRRSDKSTLVDVESLVFTPVKEVTTIEPFQVLLPASPVTSRPVSLCDFDLTKEFAYDVPLPSSPLLSPFERYEAFDDEDEATEVDVPIPDSPVFHVELDRVFHIPVIPENNVLLALPSIQDEESSAPVIPSPILSSPLNITQSLTAPVVTTTSVTLQHKEPTFSQPCILTFADIATGRISREKMIKPPSICVPQRPQSNNIFKAENQIGSVSSSTDMSIDFGTFDSKDMWSSPVTPGLSMTSESADWSGLTTPASPRTVLPLSAGEKPLKKYHSLSAAFGKLPNRQRAATVGMSNSNEDMKRKMSLSVRARRVSRTVLDTTVLKPASYVTQAVVGTVSKMARKSSVYNHYFPETPRNTSVVNEDSEDDFGNNIVNAPKHKLSRRARASTLIGEFRSRKST